MLSSMLKQHRAGQDEAKKLQEKRKQSAISAAYKFNDALMKSINDGVSAAYVNQCQIDQEMKELHNQSQRFSKLTARWSSDLNKFHIALKELGDVENWALGIENELKGVVDSLEYIHNNSESASSLHAVGKIN